MDIRFVFEMEKGQYKIPVSKELYLKNLEYFEGMGLYDKALCQEKALITTGFRIIRADENAS